MSGITPEGRSYDEEFSFLISDIRMVDSDPAYCKPHIFAKQELVIKALTNPGELRGLVLVSYMFDVRDDDVRNLAKKITSENMLSITKRLDPSDESCANALRVLGQFIDTTSGEENQKALKKMKEILPGILERAKDSNLVGTVVDHAIEYGDEEVSEKAKGKIREELKQMGKIDRSRQGDFINCERSEKYLTPVLLNSDKRHTYVEVMRLVHEHLGTFGLDGYSLMGIWRMATKTAEFELITVLNIATINDLERQKPGFAKRLLAENRIVNYARYPIGILLAQDQEINGGDVMQLVTAVQDRNGAFYDHHDYEAYKKLAEKQSAKFHIQVFEVSPEFPQLPTKAVESTFGIMQIHGEPTKVQLGCDENDKPVLISAKDIRENPKILGLGNIKKGSRLILSSCSTGHIFENLNAGNRGMGHELSETFELAVSAPVKSAGLDDIEITETSEGLVLIPKFKEVGFDEIPVKTNYFRNGQIITEELYKNGRPDIF